MTSQRRVIAVNFTVHGQPSTKGSARAFYDSRVGRLRVVNDAKGARQWSRAVAQIARAAKMAAFALTLKGPVFVGLRFYLRRPKRAKDGECRGPHCLRPDVDKLERCMLDSLVVAGLMLDDGQVAELTARKFWDDGRGPRVEVEVRSLR